ncbi:MAG: cytochrome c biogenesis protein CcsA [Bdellovibrionales bacterium]|nr:cytochrome c biogenesis protein CcsA [Bdellovibrionales bacterium]
MLHFFPAIAFVLYLGSSFTFLVAIFRDEASRLPRVAQSSAQAAFVFHTASIGVLFAYSGSLLETMLGNYFYFLAWGIAVTYIFFRKKLEYPILGVMITAAVALFMLSSSFLVHFVSVPAADHLSKALVGVHVVPAIAAEVCLVLCFIVSLIYLIQEDRLKTRSQIGFALRGPSLSSLKNLQFNFLLVGFVCMSAAILTGCVWAWSSHKSLLSKDLLQWVAFATWGLLGYLLHLRLSLGLTAKRVSQISLCAGGLALLAFLLVRLISFAGAHGV